MKKRLKKRGFELSINFLVVMIISIVIFGLGIVFVQKIFSHADTTQAEYFEKYEREVQNLLCDADDLVCVPKDTIDFGIDNEPVYGVVINNFLGASANFELTVGFSSYFDKSNTKICGGMTICFEDPDQWKRSATETFNIPNNGIVRKAIALSPKGAKSGTYVFDVRVCTNVAHAYTTADTSCTLGYRYSSIQKIYLYVP